MILGSLSLRTVAGSAVPRGSGGGYSCSWVPLALLHRVCILPQIIDVMLDILGWGFACSRLKKMQKRIIRIITCSKYNAHASPLFKSLRILTLDDMLRLNTLKFYYKYLHNELPPYFYSFNIREQGDRHTYDTRNSGQLQVEMTRTEYADKRLRIYLPTLVNDTPTDILAMITLPSGFHKKM